MTSTAPRPCLGRGLFYFGGDDLKLKHFLKHCIAAFLCIALLCCAFVIPVGAAGSGEWFEIAPSWQSIFGVDTYATARKPPSVYDPVEYSQPLEVYEWYGSSGVSYNVPYTWTTGTWGMVYQATHFSIALDKGETFTFTGLYEGTAYETLGDITSVNFEFLNYDPSLGGGYTSLTSFNIKPTYKPAQERWTAQVNFKWQSISDVVINCLRVTVTIRGREDSGVGTAGRTRFYLKQIKFGWGNPNSATAPKYDTPDDGDLGSLEDKEQELESNTAEGQEEVQEIISAETLTSTLLSYAKGLQFTSRIMLSAITKIPFLNALIWVSMSLGFVATLFALSASIIAASDRRAGATARAGKHSRR